MGFGMVKFIFQIFAIFETYSCLCLRNKLFFLKDNSTTIIFLSTGCPKLIKYGLVSGVASTLNDPEFKTVVLAQQLDL